MYSPVSDKIVESTHQSSRLGNPIERIVMHTMEAPEEADTAEDVARYFIENSRKVSAHYCVDNDSVVGCVPEERVANHAAGDNLQSIGIELAGRASQTREQWADAYSRAELLSAAKLCANIGKRRGIPARFLSDAELSNRVKGFVSHDALLPRLPSWQPQADSRGFALFGWRSKRKEHKHSPIIWEGKNTFQVYCTDCERVLYVCRKTSSLRGGDGT